MPNRANRRDDQVKTRDEYMRLGGPPHPATEPNGAEGSARDTETQLGRRAAGDAEIVDLHVGQLDPAMRTLTRTSTPGLPTNLLILRCCFRSSWRLDDRAPPSRCVIGNGGAPALRSLGPVSYGLSALARRST